MLKQKGLTLEEMFDQIDLDKNQFIEAWEAASPKNVYIGRPSQLGNPSVMDGEKSRTQVVAEFRTRLRGSPELSGASRAIMEECGARERRG